MNKKEKVLVVKTDNIKLSNDYVCMFKNFDSYDFISRNECEENECYKQLIPYCFITYENQIFLYQRINGGDNRLLSNYSIGFGGHCNKINDINNISEIIRENLYRELEEELNMPENYSNPILVGFINDESNPVGKVHLGIVYHLVLKEKNISIKEKDKLIGRWIDTNKLKDIDNFENWSNIIIKRYFKE